MQADQCPHSDVTFKQWIDECCLTGPEYQTDPTALLESFIGFSGRLDITPHKLGRMLKEAGFEQRRVFSGRFWVGIGLQDGDNVTQRGRVAKLSKEGLTGVEIAKQLGVHKSTVSRHLQAIKTGRPYGRKKKSSKNPVPTTALQAIENGAYRAMKEFLATAEDQVLEAISAIYHEGTVEQSDGRPENPLF